MKKILCLFLAFVFAFCMLPVAAAGESGGSGSAEADTSLPFLLIRGMDFTGLTYLRGTVDERNVFGGVNAGKLISTVLKGVGGSLIHRDPNVFADTAIAYAREIMGLMACDENGKSKYDVSVEQYTSALSNYPDLLKEIDETGTRELGILKRAVEEYGAQNVYYYNYDWRLDPFEHADKIAELIDTALRETGKSKIRLACASMGGILTVAYLTKYGASKLERVLFLSSTFYGTYVTSDLFRGEVKFRGEGIYQFLQAMVAHDKPVVSLLFKGLRAMGLFRLVEKIADWLVPQIKERAYDSFMRDTFGTMPSLWALVLPEYYDACIQYMFAGKEETYAGIINLSKQYQEMVKNRDSMLKSMMANGLKVAVVASYDLPVVPAYEHADTQGDTVLESSRMLGGAVVSPLGETLPDSYAPADPVRLSPDRMVDLSPVLLPESTWAIRGAPHVASDYGTDYSDFVFWLLAVDRQPTVTMNPRYPQFMQSSYALELRQFDS